MITRLCGAISLVCAFIAAAFPAGSAEMLAHIFRL